MPTEIRRSVDVEKAGGHISDGVNGAGGKHGKQSHASGPKSAESVRRKYAVLILCIPVLTGAYALLTTQACEDDDVFGSLNYKESFLDNDRHGGILHAKKSKHSQKQQGGHHKQHKTKAKPQETTISPKIVDYDTSSASIPAPQSTIAAHQGDSACFSHADCGIHGKCLASGQCGCAILYEGLHCERARLFPAGGHPKTLKKKSLNFKGEMVLHQEKMKHRDKLKVFLPGKEKDPDKGHRVLSSGDELKRLNQILPKNDTILNAQVYDKCAVVGSSGIVLSYEHGKEIDSHDFVMRFNSAPTKGFEKHVGSFTTHRITNTQNWAFRERDEENLLIHLRAKSAVVGLFYNYRSKSRRKKEWIPHLWAFDPEYVEYVAHSLSFMATSGLYGILMALQRCREVNIYGFHVSTKQGALYHYYDVCDVPANPSRDGDEFRFVKALVEAGFVNFAEDCVLECHETQEICDRCKEEKQFVQAEMASAKHCNPKRVSEGHNIVPWASRRAKARHSSRHKKDPLNNSNRG